MTLNPMHFNEMYAGTTELGEWLVNGLYVIAFGHECD